MWYQNHQKTEASRAVNINETGELLVQQFQKRVLGSINTLENLKSRLEITNGDYFEYWEYDASLIIDQNPSFLLVEWIDANMIIQRVEPMEGNEEAIGLDISNLDYRRSDWERARDESHINFTHWLELVQGPSAFLVDAPVYFEGKFQGTITAAMDFAQQFNAIMEGLDQYHVTLKDENGVIFYESGEKPSVNSKKKFESTIPLRRANLNSGNWAFSLVPNRIYESEQSDWGLNLNLVLGILLSVLASVLFFFMQTAYSAQREANNANEKIRALIGSSPMAIYAIDSEGTVTDFWNKAAEELLGWSKEEVLGHFMPHVADEKKEEYKKLMADIMKDGGLRNKEIVRTRKDGSQVYLRLNVGRMVEDKVYGQLMLVTLEDITVEKEYREKLENSVHEKEVLLSEVHHRVKNNLAIIIGLIELQKQGLESEKLKMILKETQNRMYSIAGVHELLYNTDNFTEITFEEYAIKLIDRIRTMFDSQEQEVVISHRFETKRLNINQAIPLGLLLNELITNSFKHAFDEGKKGEISIRLFEENDMIKAEYSDNGKGVDKDFFKSSNTLGVTLIKTLLSQIGATYELVGGEGFHIKFQFNVKGRGSHSNL